MADDDLRVLGSSEDELREQAIDSLKRKQAFRNSLISYVLVNAVLVVIWAVSGSGYFWPVWVIGGWGIGLAFQAYHAYGRSDTVTEAQVSEEMDKLRGG